jgi:hypothetical protein
MAMFLFLLFQGFSHQGNNRTLFYVSRLIRNLCQSGVNYHLIPNSNVADDTDILRHLQEKGVSQQHVHQFYDQVVQRVGVLYQKYHQIKSDHFKNPFDLNRQVTQTVTYHNNKKYYVYRLEEIYVKLNLSTHTQIMSRYRGPPQYLNFFIFEMSFNYYMLDGPSFQWAIPPKSITTLNKSLSVTTELFASPINAVLPNYYSLFYIDRWFGATDNFFHADRSQLCQGTYEVNPPFIEKVFIDSARVITDLLQHNEDLLFIYIMPNWLDSEGYQMLINGGYLLDEIILPEKNHFYYQSSKRRMIPATFETHLLIVGTPLARLRWTPEIKDHLVEHFTHY